MEMSSVAAIGVSAAMLLGPHVGAIAQGYPTGPVRMIVPFPEAACARRDQSRTIARTAGPADRARVRTPRL
jgi:hypothetical protein